MNNIALIIGGLGTTELIIIVAILFLLFGATRLPQLAKSLGQSKRAFKEGLAEAEEEERREKSLNAGRNNALSSMNDEELFEEARRRAQEARK
jgi:sec-independent protein translocase protein TatA